MVLNESVLDLGVTFQNFFASIMGKRKGKRVNPPRFKKRRGRQSIRLTGGNFKAREHTLTIPKVGRIPITWSRNLPSTPSSVTLIKDAAADTLPALSVRWRQKRWKVGLNLMTGTSMLP